MEDLTVTMQGQIQEFLKGGGGGGHMGVGRAELLGGGGGGPSSLKTTRSGSPKRHACPYRNFQTEKSGPRFSV